MATLKCLVLVFVIISITLPVSANKNKKESVACVSYSLGFAPDDIKNANNPIDLKFTKDCHQMTCQQDARNSSYLYYEAWKTEFKFAADAAKMILKEEEPGQEFRKFKHYISDIEKFDDIGVMFGYISENGEMSGGTIVTEQQYVSYATFYRIAALYIINNHLKDYKYHFDGASLNDYLYKEMLKTLNEKDKDLLKNLHKNIENINEKDKEKKKEPQEKKK